MREVGDRMAAVRRKGRALQFPEFGPCGRRASDEDGEGCSNWDETEWGET